MSLSAELDHRNVPHTDATTAALPVKHPLQPLTPAEIKAVAVIVDADPPYGADSRFETIELFEPEKSVVRDFKPGMPIARSARVNVISTSRRHPAGCLVG